MFYETYSIGGKSFYQRPMCNLQQALVEELVFDLLEGKTLAVTGVSSFFRQLGTMRGKLMALCLVPEGVEMKAFVVELQRPGYIEQQVEWFDYEATPGERYRVIADFFDCNQMGLCIDSLTHLMNLVKDKMDGASDAIHGSDLKSCVPSSLEATQQTETPSTP